MCEKCDGLDDKIAHYRRMAFQLTDRLTLDAIAAMIDEMRADKAALSCAPADK